MEWIREEGTREGVNNLGSKIVREWVSEGMNKWGREFEREGMREGVNERGSEIVSICLFMLSWTRPEGPHFFQDRPKTQNLKEYSCGYPKYLHINEGVK